MRKLLLAGAAIALTLSALSASGHDDTHDSHEDFTLIYACLLYTSPSPRDATLSRMPSSA